MDEVKKSYYALVKKYHPDLNKDNPDAEEKFKTIVKAYETLIDPNLRQIHDLSQTNSNFNTSYDEEGSYQKNPNHQAYYNNKWYNYQKPNYESQRDAY